MTNSIEHNVSTGEIIERSLTIDEIADLEKTNAIQEKLQLEENAKGLEKAALLARLGLTADEAKLLLS